MESVSINMDKHKPIIGITMGDPSGIGPEIVIKALTHPEVWKVCRPWVIGDEAIFRNALRTFDSPLKIKVYLELKRIPLSPKTLHLLQVNVSPQKLVIEILRTATTLALAGKIQAIVTAPIHKSSLAEDGINYAGHTEFFAAQAGVKEVGMMMVAGPLKVMLVTTHVSLRDLPGLITQERVETAIRLTQRALVDYFGIKRPKIAVAALNPHAGEEGLFGLEEGKSIGPAIELARSVGMIVSPPLPADTAFRKAAQGEYDAVVAMYHDQALIPVKLLAFGKAVNLTVGLPFIRTSVDHGTAEDIAGKGVAHPGSLITAIKLAARLARRAPHYS
jgi:4-hydroxythreonine-4-phosphate dehydrogenase